MIRRRVWSRGDDQLAFSPFAMRFWWPSAILGRICPFHFSLLNCFFFLFFDRSEIISHHRGLNVVKTEPKKSPVRFIWTKRRFAGWTGLNRKLKSKFNWNSFLKSFIYCNYIKHLIILFVCVCIYIYNQLISQLGT